MRLPPILADQRKRLDQYFNFFMPQLLSQFILPKKLALQMNGHWAVQTFVKLLDGMIADYRSSKYKDQRAMNKLM